MTLTGALRGTLRVEGRLQPTEAKRNEAERGVFGFLVRFLFVFLSYGVFCLTFSTYNVVNFVFYFGFEEVVAPEKNGLV